MRTFFLLALGLGLAGCLSGPVVSVTPRFARLDVEGDVGVSTAGGSVSGTSSADALGLDEETVFLPRADLRWGSWRLGVTSTDLEYSGDGRAEATLRLGGREITAGTPVRSDLEASYFAGELTYGILPGIVPSEVLDVAFGLGVGRAEYDLEFRSRPTGVTIRTDDSQPFAYLVGEVSGELGPVGLRARLAGVGVELGDEEVRFFDADLSARYRLFGEDDGLEGHGVLGYRYYAFEYEWDEGGSRVDVDLTLDGPYLGLELRF